MLGKKARADLPENEADTVAANQSADAPGGLADTANTADSGNGGIPAVLRVAGSLAGQTTLIGTLLFYFGWARTQAALGYFGINASVAHLSVSDYILRSVDVTVRPLVVLGLLALLLLGVHRLLTSVLATWHSSVVARTVMLACILAGIFLCALGVLGFFNWVVYSSTYPFVPILLAAGVTLAGYGFQIPRFAKLDSQERRRPDRIYTMIMVLLDIALTFWVVAVYAGISGKQAGEEVAADLGNQPSVVVYSERSLGLAAPSIQVQRLQGRGGNGYNYRYSNLKLLLYSDGQYFLLPDNWIQGQDPVFLLKEGGGIRFEFYTGS